MNFPTGKSDRKHPNARGGWWVLSIMPVAPVSITSYISFNFLPQSNCMGAGLFRRTAPVFFITRSNSSACPVDTHP
jgi:hypothetical protein